MRRLLVVPGVVLALLLPVAMASAAPPTITYTIDGIVGTNGWYRGSTHGNFVVLHWVVSGAFDTNCPQFTSIPGPTSGTTRTCWASNSDGKTIAVTRVIRIDADPPTAVAGRLSRAADYRGWYTHPVGIVWSGRDAVSGIASCSGVAYTGPDRAGAVVPGGCVDRAGNSTRTTVTFNYDATAPVLTKLSVTSTTEADVVHWTSTSLSDRIVVQRRARGKKAERLVFQGSAPSFADSKIRPGIEYIYSVRAFDQAGNASAEESVVGLPKVLTLRKTRYVPRAAPKPILRWRRARGATYYHVQLFRRHKRVLASWPTTHQLGLPAAWRWAGHRYRLRPGHYRWYVWAGLGARSFARYRTIGSAQFIVPRR
jgi:hypothetical protein